MEADGGRAASVVLHVGHVSVCRSFYHSDRSSDPSHPSVSPTIATVAKRLKTVAILCWSIPKQLIKCYLVQIH